MKKILSFITVIAILFALAAFCLPSYAADEGEEEIIRVLDFTGYLTSGEIDDFEARLAALVKKYDEDLVVVMLDEDQARALQEEFGESYYSLMSIADDIYDYSGYGVGEKKSGMLILLRIGEPYSNHFHLSTAGDLIGRCDSDEDIDDVYYSVKPYLVSEDYSKAVDETVKGMERLLEKAKGFHLIKKILISLLIGLVSGGITVLAMKSKLKSVGRQRGAANYVIPGSFNLVESRDLFLYSTVSRTPRADNSSRSGGGGHTSSSGVSHGGGTR